MPLHCLWTSRAVAEGHALPSGVMSAHLTLHSTGLAGPSHDGEERCSGPRIQGRSTTGSREISLGPRAGLSLSYILSLYHPRHPFPWTGRTFGRPLGPWTNTLNTHTHPSLDAKDLDHYYRTSLCSRPSVPTVFGPGTIGGFCPGSNDKPGQRGDRGLLSRL